MLNEARQAHHLSIRDAARIAGVPSGTVQGWLSGRHFPIPALRANCLRLVEEVGLAEAFEPNFWNDEGLPAALRDAGHAPYLGLRPFTTADAALFHGRAAEVRRLADAVTAALPNGIIAVIGASGSGKSSMLAAGLVARETTDGALAGHSVTMLGPQDLDVEPPVTQIVVIDQFEEVLHTDDQSRRATLEFVGRLARERVVVIALRSDAFAAASSEPVLAPALAHPFLLSPLSRDELRDVITGPAAALGVRVEDDLVTMLVDELATGATTSPGVLPLLSNALLATWAAGQGNTMTVADYRACGGVASAVDELAERVFGSLEAAGQEAARTLFLRLIRFSDDTPLREAMRVDDLDAASRAVADLFVDARMLTLTDGSVRISHDALLEHWGRLKGWVDQSRADLEALSTLKRATQLWLETDKDPDSLIPVQRLDVFSGWIDDPGKRRLLTPEEDDFLQASSDHFASVLAVEQRTNRRLQRQRGGLIGSVALVSALALVVGVLSVQSQHNATEAATQRNIAQSRQVSMAAGTIRSQDPNLQAQMAAVASRLADSQEGLSALLDATSIDVPTRWLGAATSALGATTTGDVVIRANGDGTATLWRGTELTTSPGTGFVVLEQHTPVFSVAVAQRSGRVLALFAGPDVRALWDVTNEPRLVHDFPRDDATTYAARFEPNSDRIAFGAGDGSVSVFDISTPEAPTPITVLHLDPDAEGVPAPVSSLAWGPDGLLVVGGAASGLARWRLDGAPLRLADLATTFDGLGLRVLGVAINGSHVVAGLRGNAMLRWKVDGDTATALAPVTGFTSWVNDVAFAADGSTVIAGSSDQTTRLVDTTSGQVIRTLNGPAIVTGVALVDGQPVSAATDGSLRVWPATSPVLRAAASPVYNVGADGTSTWLAAGTGSDGIALWRWGTRTRVPVPAPPLDADETQAGAVTVAPSGKYLLGGTRGGNVLSWRLDDGGATFTSKVGGLDGTAAYLTITPDSALAAAIAYNGTRTGLYRVDETGHLAVQAMLETPTPQLAAFSRDGRILAVALADDRVLLYSVLDPTSPSLVATLTGFATAPISLAFSPTAERLAVGEDTGHVSVWDTTDPATPRRLHELGDAHASAYGLAFSPDGQRLAAATADNLIWGWQVTDAPRTLFALTADIGRPWDLRFIDGGRRLAVAGDDGRVRTWVVERQEALRQICSTRGAPLTGSEWSHYLPGVPTTDPC